MDYNSREQVARIVKELREKQGITREKLSLALGFDNSYISKLENCNINITADSLDKIANYFNIEIKISVI